MVNDMTNKTFLDGNALIKYKGIKNRYNQLIATQS